MQIKKLQKIRRSNIIEGTEVIDALSYSQKLKGPWAGHVARISDNRRTIRLPSCPGPIGTRNRRKLRSRWVDYIIGILDAVTSRSVGVIGGEPARIEDFSYLASLWKRGKFHCGASILSHRFVLTSGYCVILLNPSRYYVLAGTADIGTQEGGQRHNLEQIIRHDHFNDQGQNDICLLKLATSLVFNSKVSAVRLPESNIAFSQDTFFNISGWGSQIVHGNISATLKNTLVPFLDRNICKEIFNGEAVVTRNMMCAGSKDHTAGDADNGGPLVLHDTVVGIVSTVAAHGNVAYPTICTKVSAYLDWIRDNMKERFAKKLKRT
ncbi:Trypsin-6 [Eumeta japonica]|uniref:Trypsin-6 n=1 Tax=Eumeta variegata TaxID=151549 RepID=A0A4C1SZ41_EUMVA|nr:Trypsin-6 [Eumeta japonica]